MNYLANYSPTIALWTLLLIALVVVYIRTIVDVVQSEFKNSSDRVLYLALTLALAIGLGARGRHTFLQLMGYLLQPVPPRAANMSNSITGQFPVSNWHTYHLYGFHMILCGFYPILY